jgi:hypothetical protein
MSIMTKNLRATTLAAALVAASVPSFPGTAQAAWGWHGGWGWGGLGIGLAAGALIGAALSGPYSYGYPYGYPYYGGYYAPYYGYRSYYGVGYARAPYWRYRHHVRHYRYY